MKYLLDTHAIVWARQQDARLGSRAALLLEKIGPDDLSIADITLLEISLLLQRKRIGSDLPTVKFLNMVHAGIHVLPIIAPIAARAASLSLPQADPFDRVIVATAIEHRLILITKDRQIEDSGLIETLW